MADEFDEIGEELEKQPEQENYDSPWEEAYDKWENQGDTSMLENLLHTKSRIHKQDTLNELKKKGRNLNYDKFDTSLLAILITSSSFIIHPVIISGWLTVFYKIVVDSYRNVSEGNNWEKLDDFGPELFYFLATTLATIYFFMAIQQQSIVLSDGGTVMQILVSTVEWVVNVVG